MEKKKDLLSKIGLTEEDKKTFAEIGIDLKDSIAIDAAAGIVLIDNATFNNDYYTREDIEEIESTYNQLEKDYEELKKSSGTKGALEDAYKGQVKGLQEKVKRLQEQLESQPTPTAEQEKVLVKEPADYQELKNKVQELEEKISALEKEKATLQADKEKIEKQGTKVETKIERVEVKVEVPVEPEDYEELKKAVESIAETEEKLKGIEKELEETKRYLEIAETSRDSAIKENGELREKLRQEKAKPKPEHTDSDYEALKEERDKLVLQIEQSKKQDRPKVQKMNTVQVSKATDYLGSQEKNDAITARDKEILRLQEIITQMQKQQQQQQVQTESKEEYQRKYALIERERQGIRETLMSVFMPNANQVPNHTTMLKDQGVIGQRYRAMLKRRKLDIIEK